MSSITSHQTDTVRRTLQADGQAWDVRVEDDYDGYRMLLIAPGVGNAEQATFFVSGTATRLDLHRSGGDELVTLGSFRDVDILLALLLEVIGRAE